MEEMDLAPFMGPAAFGSAYQFMLGNDAHAPGSVDRELARNLIRLSPQTANHLYASFTPLRVAYQKGERPKLESILGAILPSQCSDEEALVSIVEFTRGLAKHAEQDLQKMLVGGTEEEIIERGSDWCTDVARVTCVLCQIGGLPSRIIYLFNLDEAYSGHVIIEAYRAGKWGALDSSTGVIYRHPDGSPASVWQLMNDPDLITAHHDDPAALYTLIGQFRAAGAENYSCWHRDYYNYAISCLNAYYLSILEMSSQGWPGGLRWLHGEGFL